MVAPIRWLNPLHIFYSYMNLVNNAAYARLSHESRLLEDNITDLLSLSPTISAVPTIDPSFAPSSIPSISETNSSETEANIQHKMFVSQQRVMDDVEESLYQFVIENITQSIGEGVTMPFIYSNCTVTGTEAAESRRRIQVLDTDGTTTEDNTTYVEQYVLFVYFNMNYKSRYGVDTSVYPKDLVKFINTNKELMTQQLSEAMIDKDYIVQSDEAYIIQPPEPKTPAPTLNPSPMPSSSSLPTYRPSLVPSESPTGELFFASPGFSSNSTTGSEPGTNAGVVVGSLFGAILVLALIALVYTKKKRDSNERNADKANKNGDAHQIDDSDNYPSQLASNNFFIDLPVNGAEQIDQIETSPNGDPSIERIGHIRVSSMQSNSSQSKSEEGDWLSMTPAGTGSRDQTSITSPTSTHAQGSVDTARSKQTSDMGTFMGANLLMRDDSFSSDSDDDVHRQRGTADEFDRYKNEVLEELRNEVEKNIYDVDGMMSLAMTRIFMEAEDTALDLGWVGAEDPASIEASCYFEAFDWMKQNTIWSTSESFFQDMLNRIVQIVHRGLIRPSDGARLLHGCASILEMKLLQEVPNTIVTVRGLRKTNDLAQGHHFLVKSFGAYGDIVDASISPKNKGFGFVRFVQPQSVAELMKKYENSDIEIQDVSVSIIPIG